MCGLHANPVLVLGRALFEPLQVLMSEGGL